MRAFIFTLFTLTLTLPGQAPAPDPEPQWLRTLQKLQQEIYQAPLGSLDAKFEKAWRLASQSPLHPRFPLAVQIVSSFHQSQGYDLKAEQLLREAIAMVPQTDSLPRRMLSNLLVHHFESTQHLTKALGIREELAKDRRPEFTSQLAQLYERLGEIEKAEAMWKEIAIMPAARAPNPFFRPGQRILSGRISAGEFTRAGDLAAFYNRIGRKAEAEHAYRKDLEDSSSSNAWHMTAHNYIGFLSEQRRFGEAEKIAREAIARAEASSDPQAPQMASNGRRFLANMLSQAGRPEEALAVEKENVERLQAQGPSNPGYIPALTSLADTLISLNRLEEAERIVAQIRDASASDHRNASFYEATAAQTLARIRDLQNKKQEASRLRASVGAPDLREPSRTVSVHELIAPAQEAAQKGNVDEALVLAERALAVAAERVGTSPHEATGVMNLAHILKAKDRENDAQRIAASMLRVFEQAPDHPRGAEAMGSLISPLASLGMKTEAGQVIERMEKILLRAKGPESPSLDAIAHGRIALMLQDFAGVLEQQKQILARTEKRSGPKSRESLFALRAVAWAYRPLNNWSEEERVLMTLLERTVNLLGAFNQEHTNLLEHMANRASRNGQHDQAVAWIDRAIEVVLPLPGGEMQLPNLIRSRFQIIKAKNAPGVPPGGSIRWFDKAPLFQ